MSDKIIENNQVTVIGEVVSEFTYSHEVFGEGFYMMELLVKRLSNSCDRIPVMISERLIDVTKDCRGECIMVSGQFRSYNRHEELKNRLVLSVFAREIEFIDEEPDGAKTNHILFFFSCQLVTVFSIINDFAYRWFRLRRNLYQIQFRLSCDLHSFSG